MTNNLEAYGRMNENKSIEHDMWECLEELQLMDLLHGTTFARLDAEELYRTLRFSCQEECGRRVVVEKLVYKAIPVEKEAAVRELINYINRHLPCAHFCIAPESKNLLFRTSLYMSGGQLPKDKFEYLLAQFLADYVKSLPFIKKLFDDGDEPRELFRYMDVYGRGWRYQEMESFEILGERIRKIFADLFLTVQDRGMNPEYIFGRINNEKLPISITAFLFNSWKVQLTTTHREAMLQNMDPKVLEMINIINWTSYVGHLCINPQSGEVELISGVMIEPSLDEQELKHQLSILIDTWSSLLPVCLGHHPTNTSAKNF